MKNSKTILLTLVVLASSLCVSRAQTLLVRMPLTDTGAGTTCASDTSTGGANVTLTMLNQSGTAASFHGTPGGGVSGLNIALDFSSNADFSIAGGVNVEGTGNGPIADNTASTALNFGTVSAYTASIWFNANSIMNNTGNTGPRIFVLGANGIADKAAANSVGLYWQGPNEIAATINTTEVNGPVGTGTFTEDQWYFYAVTYDGTTATIYEGTQGGAVTAVASQAVAGGTLTLNNASGSVLMLGNRISQARPFDGWLDDFRFYNGAATANFVEDIRWSSVAPTGLAVSLGNNQTVLTWNALPGAASYNIFRASSVGGPYSSLATGQASPTYTDSVAPGTYYYEVSAVNANGDGTTSALSQPVQNEVVGPGAGINLLANPGFETGDFTGWTAYGQAQIISTNATYYNGGSGGSNVVAHSGEYTGNAYYNFNLGPPNYEGSYQSFPTVPGSTYWGYGWAYTSPEDLMGPVDSFWFEVEFYNINNQLLTLWSSTVATNAGTQFPDNIWNLLPITNQCQINNPGTATAGATEIVIGNTGTSGLIPAPIGAASVRYQVVFKGEAYDGGSMYFDDLYFEKVSGANPPYLTNVTSLNGVTLATNKSYSFTIVSPGGLVTNAEVITTTHALGGPSTTATNTLASPNLSVVGLNTGMATATFQLQSNLVYSSLTVLGVDENGNPVAGTTTFDTLAPSLVIEASDFNFNGGQFIDTPANGGVYLYYGQVGVGGVDENKTGGTSTKFPYRASDNDVIQAANPSTYIEQKFVNAAAEFGTAGGTTNEELELGYNAAGDWANYSRTYGPNGSAPAGTYNVWLYEVTDGGGIQSSLYQISDPTSSSPSSNYLGNFGTPSFALADGTWSKYQYLPLEDQFGNLLSVTLNSGVQTLRPVVVNNPNLGFYMLMPVTPVLTPVLKFSYPDGLKPFQPTNHFTFTVGPANGSNIVSSGVDLVLNGVDVTSSPGFSLVSGAGGTWTANYPIQSNFPYAAVINVTNTAGLSSTFTINFDTFNITNYQLEAVDYDFSTNNDTSEPPPQGSEFGPGWVSGLFIDKPVPSGDITSTTTPVGTELTNSYFGYPTGFTAGVDPFGAGALAQQGVDIGWVAVSGQTDLYRNDSVGSQPSTDYVRPKFLAEQTALSDPNIGPFNIGYYTTGSWLNYSRHYPTNNYYIWGRLAGGAGPFSGTTVSMVTSGVGTGTQTTQVVGTFADPNASGWQNWHWIPLLDTNGNMVDIQLGGLATLRVTSGNNVNMEYFMLAPAPVQLRVTPSLVGGLLNLSFPTETGHQYMIEYKSSLSSPAWTPVGLAITGNGGVTNVTETLTGTQGYYTVEVQ